MDITQCLLHAAGLCLTFAFDDLSFKAVASQSKIAPGHPILYAASKAVDRDIATCTRAEEIGMNAPDKTMWWKVDLNGTFNIFSINIVFKNYKNYDNRQRGRLAGFSLYVSNTGAIQGSTLCYKDGPQLPPLNFTTECITSGRYVIFYNERFDGVSYPTGYELNNLFTELCEVIVKGCKQPGVYGSKCDIPCPVKCKGSTCHILSGACLDCKNGVYGGYCNLSCPNSCKDNICNMQSGACLECEHGVYGRYCNLSCPSNCNDNTCQIHSGTCFACKPGWTGMHCDTKCREGWYGDSCGLQCSGHCRDGVACNHVTGRCDRGCDAGWTGTTCEKACAKSFGENCRYPCSLHCFNQTCDRFNGRCLYCCTDGFHGELCDKAPVMWNQNESSMSCWSVGLLFSLVINFVLISGACVLLRGIYTKKVSISREFLPCSKKSIYYTDTDVKMSEDSTYQELDLSRDETPYQNTAIR